MGVTVTATLTCASVADARPVSDGPSTQQPGSSDGLDDTGGLTKDAIRWHGCGPDLPKTVQCGELSVPLDYSRPQGAKITLGFNRLRAQDQAHRVGSLILNPGLRPDRHGPAEPG
jgi:hypothetical protein